MECGTECMAATHEGGLISADTRVQSLAMVFEINGQGTEDGTTLIAWRSEALDMGPLESVFTCRRPAKKIRLNAI